MTPEEIETRKRQLERRLAYNRELNRAGGVWEPIAWCFTLLGLLAMVGRNLRLADVQMLWWLGLVVFLLALASWGVVLSRRARWKRDHPFDPEGKA